MECCLLQAIFAPIHVLAIHTLNKTYKLYTLPLVIKLVWSLVTNECNHLQCICTHIHNMYVHSSKSSNRIMCIVIVYAEHIQLHMAQSPGSAVKN